MKAYSHLQGNSKLPRQEGRRMKLLRVWTYNHFFSNGNRLLAQPTEAILSFSQWNSHQEDCTHSWLQQLSRQPPRSKPHKPKTSTLTFFCQTDEWTQPPCQTKRKKIATTLPRCFPPYFSTKNEDWILPLHKLRSNIHPSLHLLPLTHLLLLTIVDFTIWWSIPAHVCPSRLLMDS